MDKDSKEADLPLLTPVQSKAAIFMLLVLLLSCATSTLTEGLSLFKRHLWMFKRATN